jgi:glycosyltransferase involved in cell wall biosynthesis
LKNTFFTIVVPTYNRAAMLSKAIDSVISQTYTNWELIIVDDGSTDHTKELVENYCNIDNRIRYIYQENEERSAARNNGIEHAKGEFICFLDSDDYYALNRLENISKYLKNESNIKSFYYTAITYDFGHKLVERPERKRLPEENVFEFIVQAIIGTPQVIMARDLLLKERFDPRWRIGEDMELWLRLAKIEEPKFIPNEASVIATEHENRSVNFKLHNAAKEQLRMLKIIFHKNHSGEQISMPLKRKIISNCYFNILKHWLYNRNRIKSIFFILKCVFSDLQSPYIKFRINIFIHILKFKSFDKIISKIEP